jgi:hypothetical protein
MRKKQVHGFQTGDMVKAIVTKGKKVGTHVGRVAIRETGSFNIQTSSGAVQGISFQHCKIIQRGDGYRYSLSSTQDSKSQAIKGRALHGTLSLPDINDQVSRAIHG